MMLNKGDAVMNMPLDEYRYTPKKDKISIQRIIRKSNYQHKCVHMHNQTEMLFITCESEALVFSNGNKQTVKTPTLVIHKAGAYHSIDSKSTGKDGYSSYCIFFDPQYITQMPEPFLHCQTLMSSDCLILPLSKEQIDRFQVYLKLMREEQGFHKKMLFILMIILDEANRILKSTEPTRMNSQSNYIFDVTQYMLTHFDEPLTTAQLAQHFHVSISKINSDFYKVTNCTVKEFCTALRLNHAIHMLTETNEPISEIAYNCGFSSESYLIQSFRKHMGTTPNSYRKQIEKSKS